MWLIRTWRPSENTSPVVWACSGFRMPSMLPSWRSTSTSATCSAVSGSATYAVTAPQAISREIVLAAARSVGSTPVAPATASATATVTSRRLARFADSSRSSAPSRAAATCSATVCMNSSSAAA